MKNASPLSVKLVVLFFLVFYSCTATAQNIEQRQLDSILYWAAQANSDGLVVVQDNKMVIAEYFGTEKTPTYIASVGKALVSIAIVKLLSDGKIKSIDQPVADFYPEWKQGQKKQITLRMLLSHTSGIQNEKNTRLEIETGPDGAGEDLVKLALAAELTDTPGTVYSYNNKAVCLLPGIIEKASGRRMDHYFEKEFYAPMGIKKFGWKRDGTGRPQGHAGFLLLPEDLAKFGQLMLNKGSYNGKRFFEERWADSSVVPGQEVNPEIGLIWHLKKMPSSEIRINAAQLTKLRACGVADSLVNKLSGMQTTAFTDQKDATTQLEKLFGADWMQKMQAVAKCLPNGMRDLFQRSTISTIKGFYHSGSWGNYLVMIPEKKLVVVRVVKKDKDYNEATDLMGGFISRLYFLMH